MGMGIQRAGLIGMMGLLLYVGSPVASLATMGWEAGDMVLDFGLNLESGERTTLIDTSEVGEPFWVELTWKLNPDHCVLQIQESQGEGRALVTKTVMDDGLLNGIVSHAVYPQVDGVMVTAAEGQRCEILPKENEFLVVSRSKRAPIASDKDWSSAPIGAVVILFRATTFYWPSTVTIQPGQKIVWIYADGAAEPHSVTSGGCRVNDCSGGGTQFNSGLNLNKPGHRFEQVFKHAGVFPYHCELHLGSMQGVVTVQRPR